MEENISATSQESTLPEEPREPEILAQEQASELEPPPLPKTHWLVKVWQSVCVGVCRCVCLIVYGIGGLFIGIMLGALCGALLTGEYSGGMLFGGIGALLLGMFGIATGIIMGICVTTVKGAFLRWFFYLVGGVMTASILSYCIVMFDSDITSNDAGGIIAVFGIIGGILSSTIGGLLYCADKKDVKKKVLRIITICMAICTLGSILAVVAVVVLSPKGSEAMTAEFVALFCITGAALGAVFSTLRCMKYLVT